MPGVAIAGQVFTANLGLETIVVNITANPRIAGYGRDVDLDVIRAWWSLRSLRAQRRRLLACRIKPSISRSVTR